MRFKFGRSPTKNWYELFEDTNAANVILDRIVHRANPIELKGESMRKLKGIARPKAHNL
ncbi:MULTISPECIES: ATP-binding protein [unclassified Methylomonas]|uniref:ATP-binding protein n=1 Tax=unclassified Methylomonas TaxID=2608980 RepID=UPI00356B68FF